MENQPENQELNVSVQDEISALKARITQLENKLDDALMIIADTYRYGKLKDLLAAGNWDEADLETTRVMIEITGRPNMDKIKPDDIQQFPCNAIMLIDQMWRKYSNDRFGFSIQLKIYQSVGGNMNTIRSQQNQYLRMTSEKIGWRKDGKLVSREEYNHSLEAPEGGLPGNWWNSPYGAKMANFFLARLIACEL